MNKTSITPAEHQLIAGDINEDEFIDVLEIVNCFTIILNEN